MGIRWFSSYREASKAAKQMAIYHQTTIYLSHEGARFYINVPEFIEKAENAQERYAEEKDTAEQEYPVESSFYGCDVGELDQDAEFYRDHDHETWVDETLEEMQDYSDSMARSDEDGWFYDDTADP